MKIEASAGRQRKKSLHDHCERLVFKADDNEDAHLLSVLYGLWVHGKYQPFLDQLDSAERELWVEYLAAPKKTPDEHHNI
jgi:hypothetical protein